MHTILKELIEVHGGLVAAFDAGDVEQLAQLANTRGGLLTALEDALAAAPAEAREQIAPDLQRMLRLDRELQARCRAMRDDFGKRLMSSGAGAGRSAGSSTAGADASGVVDRRA